LTIGELCALAYVIQLKKVEREAQALMTASGVARALGADVEIVDLARAAADFDAELRAEPEEEDDKALLLEGLGLRRWRGGNVDR